jgi:hypothetical protein
VYFILFSLVTFVLDLPRAWVVKLWRASHPTLDTSSSSRRPDLKCFTGEA